MRVFEQKKVLIPIIDAFIIFFDLALMTSPSTVDAWKFVRRKGIQFQQARFVELAGLVDGAGVDSCSQASRFS